MVNRFSEGRSLTWLWLSLLAYGVVFGLLQKYLPAFGLPEGAVLLLCAGAASAIPLFCAATGGRQAPEFPTERASAGSLIVLMSVALTGNFAVMLLTPVLERLWGLAGFTAQAAAGGDETITPLLALYVCVAGPVLEELIYRGVVMRRLLPGPRRAILLSALCFGLMHHDLYQGMSAFLGGLVFGYAALRYGLAASIGLHITSNTIAVLLPLLRQAGTAGALATLALVFVPVLIAAVGGMRWLLSRRGRKMPAQESGRAVWREPALWVLLAFDTVYLIIASFSRR